MESSRCVGRLPAICTGGEIGNNSVVKSPAFGPDAPALAGQHGLSDACARVARALLAEGSLTAAELAERLFLTPTAVRRHLETLDERGYVEASAAAAFGPQRRRGRGRPARFYTITATGRDVFESSYDDVAVSVLDFLARRYGEDAVTDFARERAAEMAERYRAHLDAAGPAERVEILARLLTVDGYAASTTPGPHGVQLCQHHCPVAHVAESHPQFCDAEQEVFSELLGVHVTRLATIGAGDGVCTTLVPVPGPVAPLRNSSTGTRTSDHLPEPRSSHGDERKPS